jgi:S-adenosylmethionine/arginine decarboxylase-like enzyme
LLRDGAALSGLVLSAAAAAGLSSAGPPQVRELPRDGLAVVLLLALGHVTVHTLPSDGTLLLDLLVPVARDPAAAIAVFARKLGVAPTPAPARDRA